MSPLLLLQSEYCSNASRSWQAGGDANGLCELSMLHGTLLSHFCPAPTTSTSASAVLVGRSEHSPAKQLELPTPGFALGTVQGKQM